MKKDARKTFAKALRLLKEHLGVRLHHNAKYTQEELLRLLVHAAMRKISIEEASAQQKMLTQAPSADAVQYHFEKKDVETLEQELDSLIYENVAEFRRRRLFGVPRDVAIDFHPVPYYGEPKAWVMAGKHERGTSYFVTFATLEIVEAGERLTLKVIPVTQFKCRERIVEELLAFARKLGLRIRRLYVDRAFPHFEVIKVLEKAEVKWVAAFSKNERVKAIIKDVHLNGGFVRRYEMSKGRESTSFNLVIVENKLGVKEGVIRVTELYSTFATNLEVDESKREEIAEWYRKRWSIETGYRVKKEFKIRTSTESYAMRVLFFFLSVAMYNLWVLFNLLLALARNASTEPIISVSELKFYYDWMFFRPEDFADEELRGLHRQWVKEGLISRKIEVFA